MVLGRAGALHRASGLTACHLDADRLVLGLDTGDGSWLRMQRSHGSRAVLWGRSALARPAPSDARRGAPDWALSEATGGERPTVVAWHVHDEWDLSDPGEDEGIASLLRPLLTVDPRLVEQARHGELDAAGLAAHLGEDADPAAGLALVARASATPPPVPGGSVLTRLRDQIHDQMRDTPERSEGDRVLLSRPPAVVQWARVQGPGQPFTWSVLGLRGAMVPGAGSTRLPEAMRRSLTNVLAELHRDEAGEESGAWLFARVHSPDGVVVVFDRAFDGWPSWFAVHHPDQGPSLTDLAWEMAQRTPPWRPAWASLLPAGAGSSG